MEWTDSGVTAALFAVGVAGSGEKRVRISVRRGRILGRQLSRNAPVLWRQATRCRMFKRLRPAGGEANRRTVR